MSAPIDVPVPPEQDIDVAVLTALRQVRTLRRKVGPPAGHEVQLKMGCVGICGSDMAYWAKGVAGGFLEMDFSEAGLCRGYQGRMGHECSGTVLSVGEDVKDLKVGDRVALEPGVPCEQCKFCMKGRYNLCKDMKFIGSAIEHVPGAMCTVFNHSAAYCHRLPPNVSLEEGAMIEPMCVALHAVKKAKVGQGHNVFVSGAGPVGLLTALCAKAAGAASVTMTDVVDAKLRMAAELGIDHPMRADTPNLIEAMEQKVGDKFDACFECCGVSSAVDLCIGAAASGGVVCVVSNLAESVPTRLQEASRREIDIVGIFRYCNLFPAAIALVAKGAVNLKPLISRRFSLAEANEAFEYFATGEPVKVLIKPNAEGEEELSAS